MNRSAFATITTFILLFAMTAVRGVDTHTPYAIAPFDARTADDLQQETAAYLDKSLVRTFDLDDGARIELILIPAG